MLTVFNLFDADANDVTYYYESQLSGVAQPVADVHYHPVEPWALRMTATMRF